MAMVTRAIVVSSMLMLCTHACELRDANEVRAHLQILLHKFDDELPDQGSSCDEPKTALDQWLMESRDSSADIFDERTVADQTPITVPQEADVQPTQGRFGCRTCGACFINKSLQFAHAAQTEHSLIHGSARPYVCHCGKRFAIYQCLVRHKIAHGTSKPYQCGICAKKFSLREVLYRHMQYVHGPKNYVCDVSGCKMQFATQAYLEKHQYVHYPETKPLKCAQCDERFTVMHSLRIHMHNVHGIELPKRARVERLVP